MAFLIALLLGGVSLLGWIGWRFFLPRAAFQVVGESTRRDPPTQLSACDATRPSRSRMLMTACVRARESRFLMLGLLAAAGVVAGVMSISAWIVPDPLAATRMERQDHIQLALNPERLVPPPTLPPSVFVGQDRPALETADRDWSRLDRGFMQSVLTVFLRLQERGYAFALLEGYRSPERQDQLAAMGAHVTNARAFQSRHQYGLAVDIAPMKEGQLVISERDPWAMKAYEALGEEAERMGLVWGGRWSLKDFGHIEAKVDLSALKAK
ncbi:MAG: M15 family metallopeptidase [Betaproteobacteria bacterium]